MFIKSVFLRITATVITLVMLLFAGQGATEEYDVRDSENCRMNFTVLSDAHIEGNNWARYKVFARSLQNVEKNKNGNGAVVFLGDSTMNGQHIENLLFHGGVSILLRGENVLPVLGNHDIGNGSGDYETLQNRWYDYTSAFFDIQTGHPYYYEVIDGYVFIVLGMETQSVNEMYMSDEQFDWLEGVLEEAAQSGKPAFVFSHHPCDYVVDAQGNETTRLTDMLAQCNREHDIFSFVGHTHMPLYLFWSFHDSDGFPEIYLPRLTQLAGDDNEIYKESGIGIEVEVYENEVYVRGRDFYNGEWRYDTADEKMCEMTYSLKNPVRQ
ncbi:MAG: metallophosphoesterase [Clostridia bacterium]|nr:metallophosphoesterase [Clostridia bacterium]